MERAIATDRELDALAGDIDDVKRPDAYRRNARSRIRDRIDRLEYELNRLTEIEPALAENLQMRVCPRDDELLEQMAAVSREMLELTEMLEDRDTDRTISVRAHADLIAAADQDVDAEMIIAEIKNDSNGGDHAE